MDRKATDSNQNARKILFIINTAGQAYTWHPVIHNLLDKGIPVKIIARNQGPTIKVLQSFGLEYDASNSLKKRRFGVLGVVKYFQQLYRLSKDFKPSMVVGFGIDAALTASRLRKPCIVFMDDDHTPIQYILTALLSKAAITPQCYRRKLPGNQIRIAGFKELAYLHPAYFKPDPAIFTELGIKPDEKYIVVRFNAFNAIHDIGKQGFSTEDKFNVVKTLEKYARVFISGENSLPEGLKSYKLPAKPDRIHHVLNYATLAIGDTGTMVTEAAVLGTPAIRCYYVGAYKELGNFIELEHKYNLIYCYSNTTAAIQKAVELLQHPDLKAEWALKRNKLLAETIDVTRFLNDFIEGYPESLNMPRGNGASGFHFSEK
jgi:predicted glycosyltransferase